MDKKDELKIIEEFIYNDEVQNILSEINDNIMDFNILEITGMGNQEIKHSNILAWLFDNSEHNLEYKILDNFLNKIIEKNNLTNVNKKLQEYIYLSNKKRDITIYREKDNIDLLIVDESNKIVIAIENKINAKERKDGEDGGQLQKYEDIINKKYTNQYEKYFIFLTIDLEEPSKENWIKANYKMITDVIENIIKTKEPTSKSKIILESYVDLLKRKAIVKDEKLEKLCEKIWQNKEYANALNILNNNKKTPIMTLFNKFKDDYKIKKDYSNLELEGIKDLYSKFNINWDEKDDIFAVQLVYFNNIDSIKLCYWYKNLEQQHNSELTKICEKIIGDNIVGKYKNQFDIKTINNDDIWEKDIDTIYNEIKKEIEDIDEKIKKILNKYEDS